MFLLKKVFRNAIRVYNLGLEQPLKFRCRDVLRSSIIGKRLHMYLAISDAPVPIKTFILMKRLFYFK